MSADLNCDAAGVWCTPRGFGCLLGMLLVAMYPAVCFGTDSFFYRDFGVLAWPTVWHHRVAFWRGELPLWNPMSHCGVPFLAQWGTMALYPGTLFYLLLPLPWSLNVFCLAHLWLGGMGMYSLARRHTGAVFGAGVAGIAFSFSGVMLACLEWPNYAVALGWMPWVIVFARNAACNGGRALVAGAIVAAIQVLSGVPEVICLTWLVAGVSVVCPPERGATALRRLLRFGLVALLGLALSAAQLLPFFELFAHSQRAAQGLGATWSLPPWGWINIVAPLVNTVQNTHGMFCQPGQEFFASVYLGAGTVALAFAAVFRCRSVTVRMLSVLAILGIWFATGDTGRAWPWLRSLIPPLAWVRYPVKALLLTTLIVPWLTASALRDWIGSVEEGAGRRSWSAWLAMAAVACVIVGGTVLAQAWPLFALQQPRAVWLNLMMRLLFLAGFGACLFALRRGKSWSISLTASLGVPLLIWADSATHMPGLNPTLPSRLLRAGYARPGGTPRMGEGRAFVSAGAEAALLESRVGSFEADYVGKRLALWSNLNLLEEVPKVNGAATLRLREQAQIEALLYGSNRIGGQAFTALVNFLGVTLATSPSNVTEWVSRRGAFSLVTAGQEPLFVGKVDALKRLAAGLVQFDRTVLLPPEASEAALATGATNLVRPGPRVLGVSFSAHRIDFQVESAAPTWIVIGQTYDRNWRARVNGQATKLWQANHAFQAIIVPGGVSRVVLRYEPAWFLVGLGISAATALTLLLVWRRGRCSSTPHI